MSVQLSSTPPKPFPRWAWPAVAAGVAALSLGLVLSPAEAWQAALLASFALVGAGLAGLFFVALQYVSGAGWSVAIRRIPEAMTAVLPAGAAGLAAIFLLHPSLYPWYGAASLSSEGVARFRNLWLSRPFFLARAALYLAVWITPARLIVRRSRRQDEDASLGHTRANATLSSLFLVAGGLTVWLASYDWIMSLEPDWYSTIFGIYQFAGLFLSGLALIILLVVWQSRGGDLARAVSPSHLRDLGTLLFAFSSFWAYIWFSQYMLIWYANIPDETIYFTKRVEGFGGVLFVLNLLLNWALPFVVLLPRASKQNPGILVKVALVVLAGRWLDLHLMIVPSSARLSLTTGIWEAGALAAAAGIFTALFVRSFGQAAPIPKGDPYLVESLHHYSH